MRSLLVLSLLLTTASLGSDKPFVRVRWKGSELRITYKNKLMTYDYGDSEDAPELFLHAIDQVKTDYLSEMDNVVYMILDIQGPSRGPEGAMSQCGAGTEAAKILFMFDEEGERKAPQIVLYSSCYKNLEPDMDDLKAAATAEKITVAKFETYLPGTEGHVMTRFVTTWFDPQNPRQGFTSSESCTHRELTSQSMESKPISCPQ